MFYRHPEMMIGVNTFALDDKWECGHPPWYLPNENSYGGFARYIRRAVRETGALTIEEAVRKATSLPARKFKLKGRGVLREGAYAYIVIIDTQTVADRGDQLNPRRYPEGIEHVLVNGVPVVEGARHTGARPSRILCRNSPALGCEVFVDLLRDPRYGLLGSEVVNGPLGEAGEYVPPAAVGEGDDAGVVPDAGEAPGLVRDLDTLREVLGDPVPACLAPPHRLQDGVAALPARGLPLDDHLQQP